MKGYLGPYKGECYHLPDYRRGSQPRGKNEIFNHAHSSLRCTIERTFDVWKNRWNQEFMPYDDDDKLLPEEGDNEREIVGEKQSTNSLHEREMDEERDRIAVLLMHRE